MARQIPIRCLLCLSLVLPAVAGSDSANSLAVAAFDFGRLAVGARLFHTFSITNDSSAVMEIARAEPSCECMSVLSYPRFVAAGEIGWIDVVLTPDHEGDVCYLVSVEPSTPGLQAKVLGLQGTVVAPTGQVRRSEADVIAGDLLTRQIASRDASCYVLAETVLRRLKAAHDLILVDVRDEHSYAEVHLPESINIPLFSVKTKSFLRGKHVVLVDEGFGGRHMEAECQSLRQQGFESVSILYGGLNAWHRCGGDLEGSAQAIVDIARMPAASLHDARHFDDWLVVDAGGVPDDRVAYLLPEHVVVPFTEGDADYGRKLAALLADRRGLTSLLVFTSDGKGYEGIQRVVTPLGINTFYLSGGADAYAAHLRAATAMRNSKTETVGKKGKGCAGCPG